MGIIKRQIYKYLPFFRWLIILVIIALFSAFLWLIKPALNQLIQTTIRGPRLIYQLLTADTSSLASINNRTNFLVLGISGGNHEGSKLADTMIFISTDKTTADTVMLSIPRDIWLDSLQAKINSAYYYGEEKKPGGGFVLAKDAVYEIFGQPIQYVLLVDFKGFSQAIDLLGGIEVKVERSFDDFKYPIEGKEKDLCNGDKEYKCRYEQVHFDAGVQQMNGETALKFVRSRNAQGEEGSDFSRSQRQQKVMLAIKDKILSPKILLNPTKIKGLRKTLGDYIKMDTPLKDNQVTALFSLLIRFVKNKNQIRTITLDIGTEDNPGFLYNPAIEKYQQWVLVPKSGNWLEIQKYVKDKIEKGY